MASTTTLSSPPADIQGVFKDPTEGSCVSSQRAIPYGGDIHKLRDDYDSELETRCRAVDAIIRRFAPWSSPIPKPTATQVRFKYRANGHYLEFLSLFLTGDRQVDIEFPRRHALVCFLLNSLEESHYQYAKRVIPKEFEKLQMLSADELELQVWQAFIRAPHLNLGVRDYATDEDREKYLFFNSVNRIRQLAIHRTSTYRWNFDTRIIKSAAACAQHLGDDALVEKIELLVKVLYVDAGGHSEYAVTEDDRCRAYNLLWPPQYQPQTTHQLLLSVQTLAEKSSYSFCQRRLPQELLGFNCTSAEHFELSQWRKIITYRCHGTDDEASFAELDMQLQKADVTNLRNAASHRQGFILLSPQDFYDDTPHLKAYLETAKAYVRALEDEDTALEIEKLEHEVLAALSKKYDEVWLNTEGCDNWDLDLIRAKRQSLENRIQYWDRQHCHFWDSMEVNTDPILPVYGRAKNRLSLLESKLGLNPESSEDTPWEYAANSPADLLQWPSMEELKPMDMLSHSDDSSPSTEQEDIDTSTDTDLDTSSEADQDTESSPGPIAGLGDDNDYDDTLDPAADQGIAVGGWNDEDDDTASSSSAGETDYDTDNTSITEDSEWACPGSAADRGIAVGGWDDAK
ncbi:MAG: hypothetical protein Q9168_007247 [Polycauliona sp. 1 TL-2023]